jgi:hypothetical protein
MKTQRMWMAVMGLMLGVMAVAVCYAAYNHQGEIDSANFLTVYPQATGTKIDSCALCHRSDSYTSGGKTTTLGSCQWCHYVYGYDKHGGAAGLSATLNAYGTAYLANGRNAAAVKAIAGMDSDGDGYSNAVEIAALRFPGDPKDDPTKVPAPSKVYSRQQMEAMPQHTQFLLMNASKSDDYYAQYSGVAMESLLKPLVLPSAVDVVVLSPDGFSQTHPFDYDPALNIYSVNGVYPAANYYYNEQADKAKNPTTYWCDYSAPSALGRVNSEPIVNPNGLKMLLALKRDGQYLTPGVLNSQNKLDGEGPFRVVPPQKNPGPPDQRSTAAYPTDLTRWVWPYQPNGDHNAGFSARSATILKIEPLPEGTTDIDPLEAGWNYIDSDQIVIYGAINPVENIKEKLVQLVATVDALPKTSFKKPLEKQVLRWELELAHWLVEWAKYDWASIELEKGVLTKMDGCQKSNQPDKQDWLKDCTTQSKLYWAVNEVIVFLKIMD